MELTASALRALEINRFGDGLDRTTVVRFLVLSIAALAASASWGAIIYLGSLVLGAPVAPLWLAAMMAAIFPLALLGLAMVTISAGSDGRDLEN